MRTRNESVVSVRLTQELTDHDTADVCQSHVEAAETNRQAMVVETEEVEERRMEVVDVHSILDRCPSELVRFPYNVTALYAAACHPQAESEWVMVAPGFLTVAFMVVRQWRSPELTCTHDERIVEQAALP